MRIICLGNLSFEGESYNQEPGVQLVNYQWLILPNTELVNKAYIEDLNLALLK